MAKDLNHYNSGRKRTQKQHEADLAYEAELYLKGYSIYDITNAVNQRHQDNKVDIHLGMASIQHDLGHVILKRWVNSTMLSFTEAKAKELARLDNLETAYWEGWERSKQDFESNEDMQSDDVMVMSGGVSVPIKRNKKRKLIEQRVGGIQFLDGIRQVIELRCKIFGLLSPQKLLVDWKTEAVQSGFAADESEANKQFTDLVNKIKDMGHKDDVPVENTKKDKKDGLDI